MITDVGVDLDGVLYNFIDEFKKYAMRRLGRKHLSEPKHWEFYEDWGLSKSTFEELLTDATLSEKVFITGNTYPNSVAGWQKLRSLGLRIHVLTHRHIEAVGQTAEWLQFNGFVPDSLHFTVQKSLLESIAEDQAAAIDDYTLYYDQYEAVGVKAFLRTHPWNMGHRGRHVSDLLDFANAVEIYNKFYLYEEAHLYHSTQSQKIIDDFYRQLPPSNNRYAIGK